MGMMKGFIASLAPLCLAVPLVFSATLASGQTNAALPASEPGRTTWTLDASGEWIAAPVARDPVAEADIRARLSQNPELLEIEQLVERRAFGGAERRAVRWLRNNPASPVRDIALLLNARALNGQNNGVKAFYYCDELMDVHPESPLYVDALRLQFDIADSYLKGRKERFLGLTILPRRDSGIDMLFRIQQRAPASPLAEQALLRTADFYWANGQFDLASDAYGFYADRYPRSPLAPQARLRQAYANLAQFVGPKYDPTPLINARAQMNDMIATYPDLAKQEDLRGKVLLADRKIARKLYLTADFYKRTGKPDSASHLCKRLIATFPDLPEAQDARELLVQLGQTNTETN
jgi:outer membrane assembly lipoprotein YfiO